MSLANSFFQFGTKFRALENLELRKLLQDKENLDYEKIRASLLKTSNIRNDIFIERLKLGNEIQDILTPEQREAMKAMQEDRLRGRGLFLRGQQRGRGLFLRRDITPRFPRFRNRIEE